MHVPVSSCLLQIYWPRRRSDTRESYPVFCSAHDRLSWLSQTRQESPRACAPTTQAPRMRSRPGTLSTRTSPGPALSAITLSRSPRSYSVISKSTPAALASVSFRPTRAELRLGESHRRHDRVIDFKTPPVSKQGIHSGIPGLVRSGMGELIGTRNVAAGKDGGNRCLQMLVHREVTPFITANTQFFQTKTAPVGASAQCKKYSIEFDINLGLVAFVNAGKARTGITV